MDVLVVGNDSGVVDAIVRGLGAAGHCASTIDFGPGAIHACLHHRPDAVVLDHAQSAMHAPPEMALRVVEQLRESPYSPPVLMIGMQASVHDRVAGLRAGADDYLSLPCDSEELAARLQAIVRCAERRSARPPATGALAMRVGALLLDPDGHRALRGTRAVMLNRREYSLLAFLMRHADQVVSRAMLLNGVWNYEFAPAANIVESNLSRLRGRLKLLGCDPVETRRGQGYMLRTDRCL